MWLTLLVTSLISSLNEIKNESKIGITQLFSDETFNEICYEKSVKGVNLTLKNPSNETKSILIALSLYAWLSDSSYYLINFTLNAILFH